MEWLAIAVFAVVILLHAGLMPAGLWRIDEYSMLGDYNASGSGMFLTRVFHWSPRPFSELLILLYSKLVAARHAPSIAIALAVCWCLWLALSFLAVGGRTAGRRDLLLGSGVCALLLCSGSIQEVFYWPMSTFPYLPTLTGMAMVVLTVAPGRQDTPRGRVVLLSGLLLAAMSSEIGAAFTLLLCIALAAVDIAARRWRRVLALSPLVIASLTVLVLVWNGRIVISDEKQIDSPLYHHLWASGRAAFGQVLSTFQFERHPVLAIPALCLIVLGLRPIFAASRGDRLACVACLLAMLAMLLAIAFGADYREGDVFPLGRYGTISRGLAILILVLIAAASSGRTRRFETAFGSTALLAGLALLLVDRAPQLVQAYSDMPARLSTNAANWRSGWSSGPLATMSIVADDPLLGRLWLPSADYQAGNAPPAEQSILRYFGKTDLRVTDR